MERAIAATPEALWVHVVDIGLSIGAGTELLKAEWLADADAGPDADADAGPDAAEADAGPDAAEAEAPAVGRRFVGTNRNRHFGEWQTTSTVIECEPPYRFAWAVGEVDDPNTTWRFTLEQDPLDPAQTVVSQWMQLGTGASGMTVAVARMPEKEELIIERRLADFRAAMQANLDRLAARVEQPSH